LDQDREKNMVVEEGCMVAEDDVGRNTRPCPLVIEPDRECYCVNPGSSSLQPALFYCREHYEECTIYIRLHGIAESRRKRKH